MQEASRDLHAWVVRMLSALTSHADTLCRERLLRTLTLPWPMVCACCSSRQDKVQRKEKTPGKDRKDLKVRRQRKVQGRKKKAKDDDQGLLNQDTGCTKDDQQDLQGTEAARCRGSKQQTTRPMSRTFSNDTTKPTAPPSISTARQGQRDTTAAPGVSRIHPPIPHHSPHSLSQHAPSALHTLRFAQLPLHLHTTSPST
jgi:hypothetical protein